MKRRERSDERRRQIIQAALSSFTELGYAKTTMADIRRRSEASTGSIYHHFKSKEQLAAAVYLEGIRSYQEGILEIVEREKRARQGIYGMVRYHISWVSDHPEWTRFLFQMRFAEFMTDTEESFGNLNKRFAQGLTEWVKEHMIRKRIRKYPRDVFIALLFGPCQEYVRQWMAGHAVTDPLVVGDEIAAAVWKALRGSQTED